MLEKVVRWAKGKEWALVFEQEEHEKGGQGEDKEDDKMEDGRETWFKMVTWLIDQFNKRSNLLLLGMLRGQWMSIK